jgi:hypothetical protein
MLQVISKLLLVYTFLFEQQKVLEKSIFISCSVLTDSATICVCLSIAFFLSSFDHGTFEEVATVSYAFMDGIFEFETEPKE